MKRALAVPLAALLAAAMIPAASAQLGTGDSPFERKFGDVKFLDAYFGTSDEKLEVTPGDQNVPFTVVLANVGTQDITGIKGQLSLPFGFSSSAGPGMVIEADSDTNSLAGENFVLTFFVNVEEQADIGNYPASVRVEYSRLRESGLRNTFFDFDFKVTGDSVINLRALDPFLTSLRHNHVVIEISNDGTAPASGIDMELQNTEVSATMSQSMTNTENVVIMESNWDLGHLGPGESKVVEFDLYVPGSLRGETLRTPMDITYFNSHGDRQSVSRIADFYVRGLVEASVYNVGVIELSGKQTIIGEIINEGNQDALFAFVTVEPLNGSSIRPTTQFIDEIEVDSPVPFNVPVEFDGAPTYGENDVKISVRYKDDVREETIIVYDTTVMIESFEAEEEGFDMLQLMVLPLAAGVGIFVFRRYKKRK
ncbi:hypothetical protein CENSYa_1507 [Cenarchaeum symbiosum A]|uniref:S-layer domain n=1 Tax=Cenarchaeum symbiosum (strain A) TaxID=414004 RepID=A0RXR2_CENSY|nr:hypothetical protein CENSYa_1507 [Cenarchaeum symbiosum A]